MKDKAKLNSLVVEAISKQCKYAAADTNDDSRTGDAAPPADILAFAEALSIGHEMKLTILTGGLCNFSYRAHFPTFPSAPSLFAKLTFKYPIMFPDKPCPVSRTQFEYEAMKLYQETASASSLASDAAITPYYCLEIGDGEMKLLITEFSSLDEQAANQFIEGVVDMRVGEKLAHSLAALHSHRIQDDDLAFNQEMKPFFLDLCTFVKDIVSGFFVDNDTTEIDRPTELARSLGQDALDAIVQRYCHDVVYRNDCYQHGDCHVFNMLVGAKPSIEMLEQFDPRGDVCVVDWEMTYVGPIGKDVGFLHPFPIACAMAHALNGDHSAAMDIIKFLENVWETYSNDLSTKLELVDVYKSVLAYASVILLFYYDTGVHLEYLSIDDGKLDRVKASLGVIGLKFIHWGFGDGAVDSSLEDIRLMFRRAVEEEIQLLTPIRVIQRGRRSSMLRASGRRVSDAHLYLLGGSTRQSLLDADAVIAEIAEAEEADE